MLNSEIRREFLVFYEQIKAVKFAFSSSEHRGTRPGRKTGKTAGKTAHFHGNLRVVNVGSCRLESVYSVVKTLIVWLDSTTNFNPPPLFLLIIPAWPKTVPLKLESEIRASAGWQFFYCNIYFPRDSLLLGANRVRGHNGGGNIFREQESNLSAEDVK